MKLNMVSLNRRMTSTFISVFIGGLIVVTVPSFDVAGATSSINSTAPVATKVPLNSTTTTNPAENQSISDGPSRGECIRPNVEGPSVLATLQSLVTSFDILTGTNVTCLSAYLDTAQTWSQWEQPWVTSSVDGYASWVALEPHVRQLVLEVDLIPGSLQNIQNPIKWEQTCAAGRYDNHAVMLGRSLVAAGLQHSVIRLGAEMNGNWEPDFIGPRVVEQKLWAKCFDNEVTSLRRVKGEDFLIDWNPNACAGNYPYSNFYPGNAYVNILGIDLYDIGCLTPSTPLTFTQLANEPYGLTHFEAFAAVKKKPMSIPEWGLTESPSGDDPGYVSGMGSAFDTKNFAFETYFDASKPDLGTLPLGSNTPLSIVAFQQWFGST